jgi:gliding motility-associated-like protein
MKKFLLIIFIFMASVLPSKGQELVVGFAFDTVCRGMITHFRSWSYVDTLYDPGDSIVSQNWDLMGSGNFSPVSTALDSITYDSAGIHTVGLKVTTLKGFIRIQYQLVPVNELIPVFTSESGCSQEPVLFSNHTIVKGNTHVSYAWDFGDGSYPDTNKNTHHQFPGSGQYEVVLTAKFNNLNTCQKDTSAAVNVAADPSVTLVFDGDTVMYVGDTLKVHVFNSLSYDSVVWTPPSKSDTIVIAKAGYYFVTVYLGGCFSSKGFNVTVKTIPSNEPVITNLFTPNEDGYNDRWEILNLADVRPCQVEVFNRYGEQVLSSSDYQNDWDGTFKGKRLANDTYYYFVRCSNQIQLKGNVNILR